MSDVDTVLSGLNRKCPHYFDIIAGENKSFHAVSSPYARENRLLSETSDIKSMRKDKPGAPPTESLYSMKKSSSSSTSGDESSQYHRIQQQQQSSQIFSSGKCFFLHFLDFCNILFSHYQAQLAFHITAHSLASVGMGLTWELTLKGEILMGNFADSQISKLMAKLN